MGNRGVTVTAILEIIVAIVLLTIYEAYKVCRAFQPIPETLGPYLYALKLRIPAKFRQTQQAKYISAANDQTKQTDYVATGSFNGTAFTVQYNLPNSNQDGNGVTISTPLDYIFYLSILLNIFAIAGLFGSINEIKELVMIFFAWNAVQLIVTFSFFVDTATVSLCFIENPPFFDLKRELFLEGPF